MRLPLRLMAAVMLFTACNPQTYHTDTPVASEVGESSQQSVDEAGGSLATSTGSAKIDVPAGALPGHTTLSVVVQSPNEVSAPDAVQQPNAVVASNVYDFGPSGTQFTQPVAIKVQAAAPAPDGQKNVLAYLDSNNVWQVLLNSSEVDGVVSASVTHFTQFAVISVPTNGTGCSSQNDPNAYCAPHSCDPNGNTCTGMPASDPNTLPPTPSSTNSVFTASPNVIAADPNISSKLTVFVVDTLGRPLAGQQVALDANGSQNNLSPTSGTSDANGLFVARLNSSFAEAKNVTATIGAFSKVARVTVVAGPASSSLSSITANPNGAPADGNSPVQIVVAVHDAFGNAVSGQSVSLSSTGTGVHFTSTSGQSNGSGNFTVYMTSTVSGQVTVTATIGSFTLTTPVVFTTGGPDAKATTLTAAPSSLVADANTASTLTVTVRDADGNPLAGQAVSLAASGNNNFFNIASGTTNPNGVFQSNLFSSTAEVKTVTASVGPFQKTASVTFVAGAPSSSASTLSASPASLTADGNTATLLSLTLRDNNGNLVAGQAVTFASSGTGNRLSPTTGTTNASGNVQAYLSSTTAEVKTVTASAGNAQVSTQVTFTGVAQVSSVQLVANTNVVVADGTSTVSLTATALDATGAPMQGVNLTLQSTGSANSFSASNGTTDAKGEFHADLTSTVAEQKALTVTFDANNTATISVVFVAGEPSEGGSSLIASPNIVVADGSASATLTATIRDAQGNPIAGQNLTLVSSGKNDTFNPAQGKTNVDGAFQATWSSIDADAKTVSITVGTFSLTTTVAFVAPAAPGVSRVWLMADPNVVTNPNGVVALTAIALDANGTPQAGISVELSATGTNNSFSDSTGNTDPNGVFRATLSSTDAQQETVTAIFNGDANITASATVVFVDAAPPGISQGRLIADPNTAAADGSSFVELVAIALDANGTPLAGISVELSASGSSNVFSSSSGTTDPNGTFLATVSSTVAQQETITAQFDGNPKIASTASVAFFAGPVSTSTSSLEASPTLIKSGSETSQLTVTLQDAQGNPVANQQVVFSSTGSDNVFTPASGTTDDSGVLVSSFSSDTAETKTVTAEAGAAQLTTSVTVAP